MKNKFISVLALFGLTLSLQAATISQTIATGVMTNIIGMAGGPVKVTQIIISSPSNNIASVQLIDTWTNQLNYTNLAYTNILTYATNYVSTWTNYYLATNSVTNLSLVDVTNSVASTTNAYPIRMTLVAQTNSVVRVDNANYYFANGLWLTNTGPGNVTVTLTFQQ